MSAKFLLTKRRSFTGPTEAPNTLPVIRNNTPECVADTCAAGRPQEEAWESLALASSFRPRLLADRCGVSLRTLERHFTKHYRLTVGKSLRKMRLNLGYKRLMHGERIKQVAYDLGYKQLSHFSRDFKRFYGVPPRALLYGLLPFGEQFGTRQLKRESIGDGTQRAVIRKNDFSLRIDKLL